MTDPSKPPSGRRMKAHAPPPPQVPQPAPRHIFRSTTPDGGGTPGMDTTENILKPTVEITLTLPQGYQTSIIEDGSKALMDLLVELCSRYHLNPALHTLELVSPEGHSVGFKPNALLGSLNVAAVLIKEKVWEEKVRRPAPKVPEKSVRLMVNYHGSQKAVVRVNPLVPLQVLIPVICDKCEFEAAHVLLLKDSISRHELPLDKSLAELGIKELYVHDQSLEDPVYSSTASLGRPGKKGFLGIFQFSRRKSKVLSTVSGIPCLEDQTVTLGQSQSVTSIPSMSLKAETKKRRAPAPPGAPTPTMGHASYEGFQMGLGSESQLRKRKAPAPPSTPTSDTLGSDDASASDAPTPDSCDTETPTPALFTRVAQSVTVVSAPTVVAQQAKLDPLKIAVQPLRVCDDGPNRSSPTPSSSTADSLTVQDSSSELSHSINDSDTDLDQAGSRCSTLTSSSESGSARVQTTTTTTRFSTKVEESASGTTVRVNQEVASDSSSRSETESALNLKLEEVENNRHSAIGNSDRPVPPKPRRSPAREPPQPVKPPTLPTLHSPFPPIESTESNHPQNFMEVEDAAPQSWLHSMQSGQKPLPEAPEDETLSLGRSSSGASSLPDQGYAASEGMAEGEDSGMVSSPSDTQPTSPDGSLSLDGNSRERGEKLRGPPRDSSSDSDEGCATWRSIHRHNDISPQAESARLKKSYEDDNELTAQLHQTLADFEADPAGHVDVVSAKDTWYTTSRDSNDVPVSVVDMDVPVTAIDEVIEEYERHNVEHETKLLNRTESASSRGSDFKHKSNVEPQNKNNNACTAAVSDKKSIATMKQSSQLEQHSKPQENKFISVEKGEKIIETKKKKTVVADANRVKENKPAVAAKSNVDTNSKSTEVCSEKGADRPSQSQRSVSAKQDEDMYKVYQTNSGLSTAQGKITRNVTSRFGMKTFTVVPPKPAVIHAAAEQPAVRSTAGAIRIDDQGNMVTAGIAWNKVDGSSESETNSSKVSPLLGKAKAFWSSNERHDSVHSKSPSESESKNSLKNYSAALVETQIKNRSMEELKTTQSALSKTTERIQLEKVVKEEFDEPEDEVKVSKEEQQVEGESKISKSFQLPSNKPVLPPPLLPDLKRDLSFLKPSRRTSSQYVASAINKYAPKSSAQPTSIPKTPDYSTGLQRSGRSIQVNPHQSSQSFFSDNKENVTVFTSKPSGPIRSMSYPEYVSDSQRDFEEERRDRGGFENKVASTKETLDRLEGQSANNNYIQSSGSTQIKVTTHNDVENIKHIRPRSPSPATIRPFHSSTKPPTAPKIISQTLTNSSDDTTKTATHRSSITRPQPSVTVSDSSVTPGPPAVTLFGPITKFRPVIHKAVEKETSLHTSLMEAIQTGGGRGRLKKTSTSSPSSVTKVSCMEEESERSALLAAVRAQSSSSKLRKTKSEAADELEKFRKEASEEQRNLGPSSPSLTCTSPVSNPPPPPPPAPTVAPHHPPPPPPPPPPVLPQAKSCSVAHPSTNASMNPSLAREAMLEAIRSGSAAEKLKKVAAPTKTLQVNGRLGTIQPTSSTSIPQ